ncbi:MAG: type II secretion system F family protein [Acidimicrobiia bacterium]
MLTVVLAIGGPLACVALVKAARRAESGARAQRLTTRARWRLPPRVRGPLARALHDADVHLDPEAAFELWAVGALGVAILAMSLSPGMAIPAWIAGVVAGPVALRLGRTRRERRFFSALPGTLEQVAAELRGGGTVAGAVDRLATVAGPVADDLRRVHVRTRLGLGLSDALVGWPTEHDTPGVRAAAGALAVASTLGGRAADAIDGLASSLRHRLDASAEAHALSAQSRLSAVVVGVAPIGYLAFSSLVDPSSVTVLVGTGLGRVCLVLGLGLEGIAALWIRRIVRSEA